ncbi:MAG: peptide MFS transporter [Bryobacteraceae bacterium]|nr:peptide MFS transporter [Bryobacteraceae bacterium]
MNSDRSFFGHPRGLATLFFTEMWERFSYYGMRALLILFMTATVATGGLGFDTATAGIVYGLYTSSVYLLSLPGGWLADQFLGLRRAVLYGGILIMLGQFTLAIPTMEAFYGGLALIVFGTGLLKPNVSAIVGQLYGPEDQRRDAGFSIFYMGINLGAFIAPLACGWVGQRINYRWGFMLAGFGMALGLIQYSLGGKHLGDAGLHPARAEDPGDLARRKRQLAWGTAAVLTLLGVPVLLAWTGSITVTAAALGDWFGVLLILLVIGVFAALIGSKSFTSVERRRFMAIGFLFLASTLFWSAFEQAGSTLNLFAERSTENSLFGFDYPSSWYQSLNSLFLISFAPLFAWLWVRLGSREPSSPAKFSWGLIFVGLGFALAAVAAALATGGVKAGPGWLWGVYWLHTLGELSLSPVGLSAMTKLAPARVTGLMMGVWFVSISAGNYIGGRVAAVYDQFSTETLFFMVAAFAIGAGLVLALLVKPIRSLMGGVK